MSNNNNDVIQEPIEELSELEGNVSNIQQLIQNAKKKALLGNFVSSDSDVDISIEPISKIEAKHRSRGDVGH